MNFITRLFSCMTKLSCYDQKRDACPEPTVILSMEEPVGLSMEANEEQIEQVIVNCSIDKIPLFPCTMLYVLADFALLTRDKDPVKITLPQGVSTQTWDAFFGFIMYGKIDNNIVVKNLCRFVSEWDTLSDFCGCDVKCPITPWILTLIDVDRDHTLFKDAIRDIVHRTLLFQDVTNLKHLIKLDESFNMSKYKVNLDKFECALLKAPNVELMTPKPHQATKLLDDYMTSTLKDFPWYNGETGAVIAGGCVVSAVYDYDIHAYFDMGGDVDIMIVGNENSICDMYFKVLDSIKKSYKLVQIIDRSLLTQNCKDRVTSILASSEGIVYDVKFQIIRVMYPSPYHIVTGFDIDVCGMLYFPGSIYVTANSARAVANGFNLYDANKLSFTAEARYTKYMAKYGLYTLVSGVSQFMIDKVVACNMYKDASDNVHDVLTLIKRSQTYKVHAPNQRVVWKTWTDCEADEYFKSNSHLFFVKIRFFGMLYRTRKDVINKWMKSDNGKKMFVSCNKSKLSGSFFPVVAGDIYARLFAL